MILKLTCIDGTKIRVWFGPGVTYYVDDEETEKHDVNVTRIESIHSDEACYFVRENPDEIDSWLRNHGCSLGGTL